MAQHNWAAESGVDNYCRNRQRIDRQQAAKAEDRRTAGRAAGRNRRSI